MQKRESADKMVPRRGGESIAVMVAEIGKAPSRLSAGRKERWFITVMVSLLAVSSVLLRIRSEPSGRRTCVRALSAGCSHSVRTRLLTFYKLWKGGRGDNVGNQEAVTSGRIYGLVQ
ncbi:unnamed protein product [Boreogadus saida]